MAKTMVPYDREAEEALLGACLLSATALEAAASVVHPDDFYVPANGQIFASMLKILDSGNPKVDAVIVANQLGALDQLDAIGGSSRLITIQSNTPAISNADRYARIVQEMAVWRRMQRVGHEIAELTRPRAGDLAQTIDRVQALAGEISLPVGKTQPSLNAREFLDEIDKSDWLVEGLIEVGDRTIITAAPGAGKSTLLRQIAVQLAAGLHPFRLTALQPIRTMICDVENSRAQVRRKLRGLVIAAGDDFDPDNLRIEVRPEGIDLLSLKDQRWLVEKIAANQPQVLMIGPIYKLYSDDPNEEQPARKCSQFLDLIRRRYGVAMFIEAHSPHASGSRAILRPFGASLWTRWPEFGFGLRPTKLDKEKFGLETWRGPRDERDWPKSIRRGGRWPWSPAE